MKTNLPTAAIFLCLSIGSLALTSLGQATEPNPSEPTEAGTSKKTAAVAAKERKEYSEIIADNSYLVENAINIVPGNLHTMMSCTRFGSPSKNVNCGITQEIAVNGGKQLFSYSLPYSFLNSNQVRGAGDMAFSFRHQLTAEKDWAVISPRFTAFVPSGKHALGLGTASPALQFNLPVTKRLSEYFLASFNSGVTYVPRALGEDEAARPVRRGLVSYNVGGSLVWRANRSFNPLVEYVENFGSESAPNGRVNRYNEHVVSPGVGLAWKVKNIRVSPGFGVPVSIRNGEYRTGILLYFAIEHLYRRQNRVVIAKSDNDTSK